MNGILLIDKPKGWTSFDVVAKVRNILRQAQKDELLGVSHLDAVQGSQEERAKRKNVTLNERLTPADKAMRQEPAGVLSSAGQQGKALRKIRVGHTGTLDPLATGLLVLLVGSYTKKAAELTKLDKTYEVTIKLGETSTTGDEEGEKTKVSDKVPEKSAVLAVLRGFEGKIQQTPPKYSAMKINGQRAYKLARAGKEVKLEPRTVTIYKFTDVKYDYPYVWFTAKVSSGTYIRSLAEDIGQKLGTGAYMGDLRRTKVGEFSLENALSMSSPKIKNLEQLLLQTL